MNATTIDKWRNVIPASGALMSFSSACAFLTSLFLTRWAVLMTAVRGLSAQRLNLEAQIHAARKIDPTVKETLDILEYETEQDLRRGRRLRLSIIFSLSSLMLFLLCSFLEGLVVFNSNIRKAVSPMLLIAVVSICAAIVVGGWETLLSVDPEKIRTRKTFLLREMSLHPTTSDHTHHH